MKFSLQDNGDQCQSFFQSCKDAITGLAISHKRTLFSFPKPPQIHPHNFGVDTLQHPVSKKITAERIWWHCGKVRVTLTVYLGQSLVSRVDVENLGEIRFVPGGE